MKRRPRVLILTYYWPPSGGAGVQRWLKFVKHLPDLGYDPVVYTVEDGEYPSEDYGLFKDVPEGLEIIKTPIWEPYDLYKKFIGQKKEEKVNAGFISENKKSSKLQDIAVWLRGNLFIPDARKFWIKPSIKYLMNYLRSRPVDIVISSGPPHSMHLIAQELKHKLEIPWIADFRDPWTNIDFYKDLKLSNWADKKHKRLEKGVLTKSDKVITVGPTLAKELEALGAKDVKVITNGYDQDDFVTDPVTVDEKISIVHIGSMNRDRNPENLWKYLGKRVQTDAEFAKKLEVRLIGKVDIAVLESIEKEGLNTYLNKIDYLAHSEVVAEQKRSKVLLLVVNNTPNALGILTGKMFEYMAAERPILMIGPKAGDAAKIIDQNYGEVFGFEEENFDAFFNQDFDTLKYSSDPKDYERKALTGKLVEVMDEIIAAHKESLG
ncbi:glycosyltransferase [Lishizhenia sp.]|uniref:glycosyltransferase n=1 Tax=Lishizhenia sp. TaxID=2497594 RepID=UPI00299E7990|nr:glycosyltransferase [Lishizhenia sp.]MDX1445860.1 glycosyltransferase [Lishizhenia sp.]